MFDGSTNLVSAESIGGKTNADGTVTLTSASGEMKTLPETGEAGSLISLLGSHHADKFRISEEENLLRVLHYSLIRSN